MSIIYKKPHLEDIESMSGILEEEVRKGFLLPRSKDSFAREVRSFFCAFDAALPSQMTADPALRAEKKMLGFCALQIYSQTLAEVRSLVVVESHRNQGIARELVMHVLHEGRELGIREFLVLTYHPNLFKKENVPNQKIWADCIQCQHFPNCNETALLKTY